MKQRAFVPLLLIFLTACNTGKAPPLSVTPPNPVVELAAPLPLTDTPSSTSPPTPTPGYTPTVAPTPDLTPTLASVPNVELVGHIGGATHAVFALENLAFVGVGPELVILDATDPARPTQVGHVLLPVNRELSIGVRDIYVADSKAYVIDGSLWVVDVSDPAAPIVVGFYDMGGDAWRVVAARAPDLGGVYAYVVAGRQHDLQIVDVSIPDNPSGAGSYKDFPGGVYDVAVTGDYAYVAVRGRSDQPHTSGLWVMDISEPYNPTRIGFCDRDFYDSVNDVSVANGYAFIVGSYLQVVDVSDPRAPYETATLFVGEGRHVTVRGNYAFIATRYTGLHTVDLSNPAVPVQVGLYNPPEEAPHIKHAAVAANYAYVLVGYGPHSGGLRVVDVSDPAAPVEVGLYRPPNGAWDVAIVGDRSSDQGRVYAYVAADGEGLQVLDVSNPAAPIVVGFESSDWVDNVTVAGDYAYLYNMAGRLQVMDISDPTNPVGVGAYAELETIRDVVVVGDYAYIVAEDDGLRVVDISRPAAPSEVGSYSWGERTGTLRLAVAGDYAYVFTAESSRGAPSDDSLRVVDISNPVNPVEVGSYDIPDWYYPPGDSSEEALRISNDMVAAGNQVYVFDDRLYVVDVSDPTSPTEADIYSLPATVLVEGDCVYLIDGSLSVVGGSSSVAPADDFNLPISGVVKVQDGYVYYPKGDDGLLIFRLVSPVTTCSSDGR